MQPLSTDPPLCFHDLALEAGSDVVRIAGRPVALGRRGCELLVVLMQRHRLVVDKRELMARVWPEAQVDDSNLRAQIAALRRLLGSAALATIQGRGYMLALPTQALDAALPLPGRADMGLTLLTRLPAARGAEPCELIIRPLSRELTLGGVPLSLGSRAFDLLLVLVARRGAVVSAAELKRAVWPGRVVGDNNLHVHISGLRRALGHATIVRIPGQGYRFAAAEPSPSVPVYPSSFAIDDRRGGAGGSVGRGARD